MASSESRTDARALGGCLLFLFVSFSVVTTVQFKWIHDLRARYDESQAELARLQQLCFPDSFQESVANITIRAMNEDEGVDTDLGDGKASTGGRHARSLDQMMAELLHAQEQVLLAHCHNGTKICMPGPKGDLGIKGEPGVPGSVGPPGVNGTDGQLGPAGPQGVNGSKGDPGAKGDLGQQGIHGPKGMSGLKGDPGIQGQNGQTGSPGLKGDTGHKGDKGDTGPMGPQGVNGTDGQKGVTGIKGTNGAKGEPGSQGPAGTPGAQLQTDCLCIKQPKIDVFPTRTSYPLGSTVNLTCESTGSQATSIVWDRLGANRGCMRPTVRSYSNVISPLQPSDLGTYRCTAVNKFGSASKAITITTNETKPLDCDFEPGHRCGWLNSHVTNTSNWGINSGPTLTANTGPDADHTLGTSHGHYLYIESSAGNQGDIAEYRSPELPSNNGSCFTFWYNMYGSDIGSLNVYVEPCVGARTQVFTRSGDQGQGWHEIRLQLTAQDTILDHRIIVQSVHGPSFVGDTAVDDFEYYPGTCKSTLHLHGRADTRQIAIVKSDATLTCGADGTPPPTHAWSKLGSCESYNSTGDLVIHNTNYGTAGTYVCTVTNGVQTTNRTVHLSVHAPPSYEDKCNFEANNLCDWKQDTSGNDHFDWYTHAGPTISSDTGPDKDHTLNNATGRYIYIETSSPRQHYDNARIISHVMPLNQSACFSFWYNMYGKNTGRLRVYKIDQCTHVATQLWAKAGPQGQRWIQAYVDVDDPSHDYVIAVEADVGAGFEGDIALDDLLINDDFCVATSFNCDFDLNTCSWKQGYADIFDWTRHNYLTQTANTGPSGDHTTPAGTGYYMYIEGSGPENPGDNANLVSTLVTTGGPFCLRLATNMYGTDMGSIEVIKEDQPSSSTTNLATYTAASSSPVWLERSIDIPATTHDFRIIIRGVKGSGFSSDAAIDDVKLHSGNC